MSKSYKKSGRPEPYSSTDNYEVAVYKGDDLVHTGTVKSAAEYLGIQKRSVIFYTTPSGARRSDRRKNQNKTTRILRV